MIGWRTTGEYPPTMNVGGRSRPTAPRRQPWSRRKQPPGGTMRKQRRIGNWASGSNGIARTCEPRACVRCRSGFPIPGGPVLPRNGAVSRDCCGATSRSRRCGRRRSAHADQAALYAGCFPRTHAPSHGLARRRDGAARHRRLQGSRQGRARAIGARVGRRVRTLSPRRAAARSWSSVRRGWR